jgi:thiol-disulfide isomerase/thioredoxin
MAVAGAIAPPINRNAMRCCSSSSFMRRPAAIVALVLLGACASIAAAEPRIAPPLAATLLDGSRFNSAEQRGKVVLINFWATWCAPCREEMPAIEAFYTQNRARGLEVIAISLDEPKDSAKVQDIARRYTFPVGLASMARYKGYGRIWRLPMTFVIDREGRLRDDITGRIAAVDLAFLEARVAPLLGP